MLQFVLELGQAHRHRPERPCQNLAMRPFARLLRLLPESDLSRFRDKPTVLKALMDMRLTLDCRSSAPAGIVRYGFGCLPG